MDTKFLKLFTRTTRDNEGLPVYLKQISTIENKTKTKNKKIYKILLAKTRHLKYYNSMTGFFLYLLKH